MAVVPGRKGTPLWCKKNSPLTLVYERNPDFGNPERIFVGDQNSSTFWAGVLKQVPRVDILLDDGGHVYDLQRTTLDAIWPKLSIPGVYICEDLWCAHGCSFTDYVSRTWVHGINAVGFPAKFSPVHCGPTYLSDNMLCYGGATVTFHTLMTVIEKNAYRKPKQVRAGTFWQPPIHQIVAEADPLARIEG